MKDDAEKPQPVTPEEVFMEAVWDALKADTSDLGKQARILASFRVAVDPAAIREAALREAAAMCDIAPCDEWSDECKDGYGFAADECKRTILALIGEANFVIGETK